MTIIRKFYAPEGEGGAGSTLPMSMTELEGLPDNPQPPAIPENGGEQKQGDEQQKETDPPVGEGEQQGEEELENDDDEAGEDPVAFFKTVSSITGIDVQVEYGDVDPLTPQGIAVRDQALYDKAMGDWDTFIREKDPRGYAYLRHRELGGTDEEFLGATTGIVLPDEATFKASAEEQTKLLRSDMLSKGVDPDIVEASISKYIKDNLLASKSMAVYTAKRTEQAKDLEKIENAAKEAQAREVQAVNGLKASINKTLANDFKFVIPATDKEPFMKYVEDNIRMDGGKFLLVSELGDELKEAMEAAYFKYKKGNLSALVAKQASTKAVQRLRTNVQKAEGGPRGQGNQAQPPLPLALKDI